MKEYDEMTIKSTKLGESFEFVLQGGAVHLRKGSRLRLICEKGGYVGNVLNANSENFEKKCRNWLRSYAKFAL